ncbi:nitroreductase family protein [Heliophilum fasciatum]|uniref:Nitroreductase n=1 Tax=Heliophilum fasciatum TaxID=35700 RepID=A0A4R2RRS0_9FIRM|nr:nitroreductase [Heliophilum fasciatum]MCW2277522.1 nitroreductase [Heliophilum fasciatum]TCP65187.1 nitroreductase [Heliophilum fasciatum]
MELLEALYTRRSVRRYTDQPVTKETIEQLLQAATQAPSAMNFQPWAFLIIQDRAKLAEFSTQAKALLLTLLEQAPNLRRYETALSNPKFNIFYEAATLLVIYGKPESHRTIVDCSLAAQNLMLAAHALGLGTCWIGFAQPLLDQPDIKASLGVPADYQVVAPIIIGYPQGKMPAPEKKPPEIIAWHGQASVQA